MTESRKYTDSGAGGRLVRLARVRQPLPCGDVLMSLADEHTYIAGAEAGRRLFAAGSLRGGVAAPSGLALPPELRNDRFARGINDPCDYWLYDAGTLQNAAALLVCEVEQLAAYHGFRVPAGVGRVRAAIVDAAPSASPGDGPATAPHVRGSETSKVAARAVAPALRGKRLAVLQVVAAGGTPAFPRGAWFTDNELTQKMVNRYGWSPHTPRPRRIELTRAGWLEDSGERRNGSTVWRPTAKAWTWWREQQNGGGA